jgi:hypothetical protein
LDIFPKFEFEIMASSVCPDRELLGKYEWDGGGLVAMGTRHWSRSGSEISPPPKKELLWLLHEVTVISVRFCLNFTRVNRY